MVKIAIWFFYKVLLFLIEFLNASLYLSFPFTLGFFSLSMVNFPKSIF